MNCVLIFDQINDLIHMKYNEAFLEHMNTFAIEKKFLTEEACTTEIDPNIIIQTFSPIVTSHRIMNCQYGSSCKSIKCVNDLVLYFEEYMGYLFITIGKQSEDFMKWFTTICITIVRYLCGPDPYQLKSCREKSTLANKLIGSWSKLISYDQSMYIEAVEQLYVNGEVTSTALSILKESIDQFSVGIECKKIHALILVQNKVLSLYSSRTATELSSADILFLIILCGSIDFNDIGLQEVFTCQVLLTGPEGTTKCLPHVLQVFSIFNGIFLVYVLETGNSQLAANLYDCFGYLNYLQQVQITQQRTVLHSAHENLNIGIKRLNETLKKTKNKTTIVNSHKQLLKKWNVIKEKYKQFFKNNTQESLLGAESAVSRFLENLKELFNLNCGADDVLKSCSKYCIKMANLVKKRLELYEMFFRIKSIKNFSFESYLEEFPHLVHFLYVDRNTNRVTTPTLDTDTQNGMYQKTKIWYLIDIAKSKLQSGLLQFTWKHSGFSYAYYLWFEDLNGQELKPNVVPIDISPWPGILYEDFYMKLKKMCFPKIAHSKIKCYEVFCLHIGLIPASVVLEQIKKLAATIVDLHGNPFQVVDLF